MEKVEDWQMIEVNGLCEALAKHEYREITKGVPKVDIEVTELIERSGEIYVEKDIHSWWSTLYTSLVDGYKSLIEEYTKKKNNGK